MASGSRLPWKEHHMIKHIMSAGVLIAAVIDAQHIDAQEQPGDAIVVTAERQMDKSKIRDAVRDVATSGRNQYEPMTKYQTPLCTEVRGLGDAANGKVAARIAANTQEAGFVVGDETCETNALVVIVDDPAQLIKRLREMQPELFDAVINKHLKSALKRGDSAIAWSARKISGPQGASLVDSGAIAGIAGSPGLFENPGGSVLKTRSGGVSRFQLAYSIEKVFTVVVFDIDQLIGAHLDQIADFSTMRILADPQPRIMLDVGPANSILTLFDGAVEDGPAELTAFDRAYLSGLYSLRPNDASSKLESRVIAAYESNEQKD